MKKCNFKSIWFTRLSVMLVTLCVGGTASAGLRMPGVFGDHMVLQRDMPVPVWGWADPGAEVTVSFADQSITAVTDDHGAWRVALSAMPASGESRTLHVVASTQTNASIVLTNVVVGEVWLCSGQSNMEWIMRQITNAAAEIADSHDPLLRHIKIVQRKSDFPLEDGPNEGWQPSSPLTVGTFTAVGTFFARILREELGVPVGLIGANWGGSKIEPWTSAGGFRAIPELETLRKQVDRTWIDTDEGKAAYDAAIRQFQAWLPAAESAVAAGVRPPKAPEMPSLGPTEPTSMYNAMIHPLAPFALRGALWYQGESNVGDLDYDFKMKALITSWRQMWGQGSFPFYYVQLTSWQPDAKIPAGGGHFCKIREVQRKSLDIPDTGMAVIIDIGDPKDIHPANKQDVGARLARWALHRDYGRTNIVPSGPLYSGHTIESNTVRIAFDYVGSGLMVGRKNGLEPVEELTDMPLERFAIAGADMKWAWADAVIDGDTVVLSSPEVPAPVHAHYAYSASPMGVLLYNRDGLPASPFKTDGSE